MSTISQNTIAELRVNTKVWGRNGQSPHSIVHPRHPMRLCQTIQVPSLKEMKATLPMGMSIVNTLGYSKYTDNLLGFSREKVLVGHRVFEQNPRILLLNNTLVTTEEFLKTENALDALVGSLRLALDAIEAQVWYVIFTGGQSITLPVDVFSNNIGYREILALGRAAVHRIAGTDNVHVLVPVIHYAAMLLDNTAGITPSAQSAVTEHHLYEAPRATIIPLAHNTEYLINQVTSEDETGFHSAIVFYPDYLPSLIVRHVFEDISIERVRQSGNDRNLRRVVLERYLSFELPTVYNQDNRPVMPVIPIIADAAFGSVGNKYSNGFDNLSAIASF